MATEKTRERGSLTNKELQKALDWGSSTAGAMREDTEKCSMNWSNIPPYPLARTAACSANPISTLRILISTRSPPAGSCKRLHENTTDGNSHWIPPNSTHLI